MPQIQTFDFNTPPRTEATSFEKTLGSFANRMKENREADVIADIYKDKETIQDAIMALQSRPGLSPSTRANAASHLIELQKANSSLINADIKRKEKEDQDQKEREFLKSIKGQNIKPTDLYNQAREHGIDHPRAHQLADLSRKEGKEARLSEGSITEAYKFEISEIDRKLKDARLRDKPGLEEQRKNLINLRKKDLKRFRNGEEDFELSIEKEEEPQQEVTQEEAIIKERLSLLTQKFPPAENKDVIRQDPKTGLEFKSDGKQWVLIKPEQQ